MRFLCAKILRVAAEVDDPGVILTYKLLQIPVHTIAYLQEAVLTYKLGL